MSGKSAMRAAMGNRDANHGELSSVYTELGCSVVDTHGLGFGFPDILVGMVGVTQMVEFKTDEGELSDKQIRFIRDWRGGTPRVIRTREDVIAHVQLIRSMVRRGVMEVET